MKCPNDHSELKVGQYESTIEVDSCAECGGVFLEHGELQQIQETEERDYSADLQRIPDLVGRAHAAALARSRPPTSCPNCEAAMERREHGYTSQILVDVCPECRGIWLDAGELAALEVFFERVQGDVAPDPAASRREARLSYFWKLREMFGGIT